MAQRHRSLGSGDGEQSWPAPAGAPAPPSVLPLGSKWKRLKATKAVIDTLAPIAAVVALALVYQTLRSQETTNRVGARQAIATEYRDISQKEFSDPELLLQLFTRLSDEQKTGSDTSAQLSQILLQAAPSLDVSAVNSPKAIDDATWSFITPRSTLALADQGRLRTLFLHVQAYLDFFDEVVKSRQDGVITEGEGNTWLNILNYDEFLCHPIVLYAFFDAARTGIYSRRLATEIQSRVTASTTCVASVRAFYPELLEDGWVNSFPAS
jgi:hypothetical protein